MAKIMIVDDSAVLAKMARINLEKAGFQVVTATDGQDALNKIPLETPDVILLDAEMPVMDGWEACEAIKKNDATKNIPVMMCTGDDAPEYLEKAKTLGAADYIVKPYNYQDMIQKVNNAIK